MEGKEIISVKDVVFSASFTFCPPKKHYFWKGILKREWIESKILIPGSVKIFILEFSYALLSIRIVHELGISAIFPSENAIFIESFPTLLFHIRKCWNAVLKLYAQITFKYLFFFSVHICLPFRKQWYKLGLKLLKSIKCLCLVQTWPPPEFSSCEIYLTDCKLYHLLQAPIPTAAKWFLPLCN